MLAIAPLLALALCPQQAPAQTFKAICYHEIRDQLVDADPDAVTVANLIEQFEWLTAHGYQPVSVDDILTARAGGRALPDKAVLITFDDARKSVIERVFPILKQYRFPAVVSVVGSWVEGAGDARVGYDEPNLVPLEFATWNDLRQLAQSGLVEIASHSYASHGFVRANPQKGVQAALVTRRYDPASSTYETEEQYRARVRKDLERNSQMIEERLGVRPRVVTWPYGQSNGVLEDVAAELGMTFSLSLDWRVNDVSDLRGVGRYSVGAHERIEDFVWAFDRSDARQATRVLCVDPASLGLQATFEQGLDRLVENVKDLEVTTVYLKAYAADSETGRARAMYFPNRHLPVEADIFSHMAQRLNAVASVEVFAWMPTVDFVLPELVPASTAAGERVIREVYEDLASHAAFQGLYFHDAHGTQLPGPTATAWTDELTARVRHLRDGRITTVRDVWIAPASKRDEVPALADQLAPYGAHYDWIALNLGGETAWDEVQLRTLARDSGALPAGHARTLILLPPPSPDPSEFTSTLVHQMRSLQCEGAPNFGTGPALDPVRLDLGRLRAAISIADYPYRKP